MSVFSFCRRTIFTILLAVTFFAHHTTQAGMFGNIPIISDTEYNALSPKEKQQYEQELQKQIASMSPDEQNAMMEEFAQAIFEELSPDEQQQVLDEVERIEGMSPEEQQAYIEQMEKEIASLQGGQMPEPQSEPTPAPKPKTKPAPPADKKKPTPKITEKEKNAKEALKLINEVIEALDRFMVKIEARVDLTYKLEKWGKKKTIAPWNGGFEWKQLKEKLNIFRAQLEKLKDRDTKTKKHKYLYTLLETEDVYNRIFNLSVDFADHGLAVRAEEGKPLTKKEKKKSNKAIRALLRALVEQLFGADDLTVATEAIFKAFEPEAQKIKKEKEAAEQRALAQTRRKPRAGRVAVVGKEGRGGRYGSYYDSYDDPYDRGNYDDYRGYGKSYDPDYRRRRAKDDDKKRGRPSKDQPKKKPTPKKGSPAAAGEKKEEKATEDRVAKRSIKNLNDTFDAILTTIDEKDLSLLYNTKATKEYLKDEKKNEKREKDFVKGVATLHEDIQLASNQLGTLEKRFKKIDADLRKEYKKEVKKITKEYKEILQDIVDSVQEIENDTAFVNALPEKPVDTKWLYLGEKPDEFIALEKEVKKLKDQGKKKRSDIVTNKKKLKEAQEKLPKKDPTEAQTKAVTQATTSLELLEKEFSGISSAIAQKENEMATLRQQYIGRTKEPVNLVDLKNASQQFIEKAKKIS